MAYSYSNPSNRLRARRLLRAMLDEALAHPMSAVDLDEGEMSPVFRAMRPHLTMDRLDGVHIYPGPVGGWHADVSLSDMPAGIPAVLGTPKSMPCATRAEANSAAAATLAMVVGLIRQNELAGPPPEEAVAAFPFEEVVISLPIGLLEEMKAVMGEPDPDYARRRISEIRSELTDRPALDRETVMALDHEQLARLHAVVAMALLAGITRWPENTDQPPPRGTKH